MHPPPPLFPTDFLKSLRSLPQIINGRIAQGFIDHFIRKDECKVSGHFLAVAAGQLLAEYANNTFDFFIPSAFVVFFAMASVSIPPDQKHRQCQTALFIREQFTKELLNGFPLRFSVGERPLGILPRFLLSLLVWFK